jgi:uncharacterized ion transporter superfamily protein YfcC
MHNREKEENTMKVLDKVVLVLFVIGLVILYFFRQCRLDIYFLVLGFAVAIMSLVAMIIQNKKDDEQSTEQ